MRYLRPFLIALVLTGAFVYLTSPEHASRILKGEQPGLQITEAAGPAALDSEEQNQVDLYRRVLPSVVNITSQSLSYDFFYGAVPSEGQGSGFILDKDGYILTNVHVIENARRIEVTLYDKKKYRAELIGTDASHDIAVIKIDAPNLQPATLGDSKQLLVGQKVFAIGNPFGLHGSMTRGIVSAVRPVQGPGRGVFVDEAIQTDAAINPGNSGGPLLNSRGEVIGINTFILSGSGTSAGVGFAIPVNDAKAVLNDIVTTGTVKRPTLGVRTLPIGPELAQEIGLPADSGLLIIQVVRGSAAHRAGLRGGTERAYLGNSPILLGGDLIVAIDGEDVSEQQDLARIMNKHRVGDRIKLTIYRGKQKMDVDVSLDDIRNAA
jgi:S1-C subfamily serine protease